MYQLSKLWAGEKLTWIFFFSDGVLLEVCVIIPPPPQHTSCAYLLVVSSLYVKLALHLCIIYWRGCGPHWRFYKWHIIPLCLTFIFKEVCFNGRAVRRPVSPWLAAAQQHADARRHSAESQSADNYRKGASSIPGGCRLGGRHAGGGGVWTDESGEYWQSLISGELGITFQVSLCLFLIEHC